MSLRKQVESDLAFTLENGADWGLPVELVSPDGETQTHSKNDPASLLMGRIVYDKTSIDQETGLEIIVNKPVITLRVSSLDRIPEDGEQWEIRIPTVPDPDAPKETFILIGRPPEGGASIGFIRLYPQRPEQY